MQVPQSRQYLRGGRTIYRHDLQMIDMEWNNHRTIHERAGQRCADIQVNLG